MAAYTVPFKIQVLKKKLIKSLAAAFLTSSGVKNFNIKINCNAFADLFLYRFFFLLAETANIIF